MQRNHYNFLENETDEFDLCTCGHKKIHHGGSQKIYIDKDMPFIQEFGCIECQYESGTLKFEINNPKVGLRGSHVCHSYYPASKIIK